MSFSPSPSIASRTTPSFQHGLFGKSPASQIIVNRFPTGKQGAIRVVGNGAGDNMKTGGQQCGIHSLAAAYGIRAEDPRHAVSRFFRSDDGDGVVRSRDGELPSLEAGHKTRPTA